MAIIPPESPNELVEAPMLLQHGVIGVHLSRAAAPGASESIILDVHSGTKSPRLRRTQEEVMSRGAPLGGERGRDALSRSGITGLDEGSNGMSSAQAKEMHMHNNDEAVTAFAR